MAKPEKQYTFLEMLAYAFEHREIVTYEEKIKKEETWEQELAERNRRREREQKYY